MLRLLTKARKRLAQEESGFTLIELLIVMEIVGILLLTTVPSYIQFKDRASKAAAASNVRSAVPAMEQYFIDHGTFVGMTPANLASVYTSGIKISVVSTAASTYCVSNTQGRFTYYKKGPSGDITMTACT